MKIFAIVNLLAIVCVAAGMDPGSVMNAVQSSIGKVSQVARRHVEKRQTLNQLTLQDVARCTYAISEYQCSSGYAQEVINIALGCRNMTAARTTSISCARNEGGQTCAAATLNLTLDQTQTTNAATCSGAVTQGSCPSTCRSFLQSARSRLGCCFNTYINSTDSPLYVSYGQYADYRLWNLCNVDLPPANCGNALPLDPPSNAQNCTSSEYFSRTVNYECMASVGQPLVDAVLRTSRCYPYATLLADVCGTNANGDFCAQVIGQNALGSESTNPLLVSLINCGLSMSNCTLSCQSTVTDARNTLGCCVNIYNNSDIGLQLPSLAYSYWNSCGVETPGFCTSTLILSTSTPTMNSTSKPTLNSATAVKAITWLIVAAMTLVYVV